MTRPVSRPAVAVLKLILTVVATWLILRGVGLRLGDLRTVDPGALDAAWMPLTLSVALLLGAFAISAWLWSSLVVALGGRRIGTVAAFAMVLVSNLGRYIPGKVFQLVGLTWLSRRAGVPAGPAASAAVLGQTLHLVAAALVGGGLLFESGALGASWKWGVLVATLTALGLLSWKGAMRGFLAWVLRWGGGDGEGAVLPPRSYLPWLLGYVVNWLVLGLAFHQLVGGLGLSISIGVATTAFAAAYLLGYVALFAPAGIGVREGFLVAFLGPVLGPGTALTVATVQRVWITGAEVLGALLGSPVLRAGPYRPEPPRAGSAP